MIVVFLLPPVHYLDYLDPYIISPYIEVVLNFSKALLFKKKQFFTRFLAACLTTYSCKKMIDFRSVSITCIFLILLLEVVQSTNVESIPNFFSLLFNF